MEEIITGFLGYFIMMAIPLLILVGIFRLVRSVVLWYWRIDDMINNQAEQISILKQIKEELGELKKLESSKILEPGTKIEL